MAEAKSIIEIINEAASRHSATVEEVTSGEQLTGLLCPEGSAVTHLPDPAPAHTSGSAGSPTQPRGCNAQEAAADCDPAAFSKIRSDDNPFALTPGSDKYSSVANDLRQRLTMCRGIVAAMATEGRPPRMTIPAHPDNEDLYLFSTLEQVEEILGRLELAKAVASETLAENRMLAIPGEWQPIQTAPQDGRTLLLGYRNFLGKWRTVCGQYYSLERIDSEWDDPEDADAGWYETSENSEDVPNCWAINPTHWLPLPVLNSVIQQPVV